MKRGPLTGGCWPTALIVAAWVAGVAFYIALPETDHFDFPNYEVRR